MAKLSKRVKSLQSQVEAGRFYTLPEASAKTKDCATAKFDESVELAFFLGVDPRHAEQMVRGSVSLPHGTGKKVRVVVFCKQEAQIAARSIRAAGRSWRSVKRWTRDRYRAGEKQYPVAATSR